MTSVTNSDLAKLTAADAQGYFRRANGPAHEAPHEGPGWMYAAGELAMTAEDLAKFALDQGGLDNITVVLIPFPPRHDAPATIPVPTTTPPPVPPAG